MGFTARGQCILDEVEQQADKKSHCNVGFVANG